MITMSCLGFMGRLGNEMFQYATLKSLSKKFNYEYVLPEVPYKQQNEDANLYECFNLNNEIPKNVDLYNIHIGNLGFDSNLFLKCPDNVDLCGFFQDVRYFEFNKEDIKKCFTFKDNILKASQNIFYSIFSSKEVISLHIRRGDYINNYNQPALPLGYYIEALNFFDDNIDVLIFSDDIDWAYSQEIFRKERFYFSRNCNNAMDLCMQTFCNYHIIANSSFSWWGSWLANSKKVVKPKFWFSSELNDQYPNFLNVDGWISI